MRVFALAACLVLLALSAPAGPLTGLEPAPGLIVSRAGLEWVWAAPCAPEAPSCGVPLIMHHGFDIPTAPQWSASFVDLADLIAAFHPAAGGQLCASPYFNSGYGHCDSGDVSIGAVWHSPLVGPTYFDNPASEAFLVRGGVIPEPSTYALLGTGVLALGLIRRLKKV